MATLKSAIKSLTPAALVAILDAKKTLARVVKNKQLQVATLDSLIPESKPVDLLKIDVQGFERAVLAGAKQVLQRTRAVLIEVNLQSHYTGDDTFPAL